MALKWIVFDAVGTVIYPTPDVAAVYHASGRKYGSQQSLEEVRSRFRAAFREAEHADREIGIAPGLTNEGHEEAFWRGIVQRVFADLKDEDACFRDLFEHFSRPSAWACFDDVEPTLAGLKQRGLRIAVASNFDRRLHPVIDGHAPLRHVECRVISSEVGFRKPSLEFFDSVLRLTNSTRDEVLIVGDDEVNDVQGARDASLAVLHLKRDATVAFEDQPVLNRPSLKSLLELEGLTL